MNIDEIKKIVPYPFDVIEGKVLSCRYIKLACQRFIDFLGREDIYFDFDAYKRVIHFILNLRHYTGAFSSKQFILEPWQSFIIAHIFALKWKDTNLRVTRKLYLEVARKNGKSALLSAIGLYLMIGDKEPNSNVVMAANSFKQAQLLFDAASNFIKPLNPNKKFFKLYRDTIKFPLTNSSIRTVAADASVLDGLNLQGAIVDEAHEIKDGGKVYNVLQTAQGARTQPLAAMVTTSGFSMEGFCYQYRKHCIDILEGTIREDNQLALIYTLDDDDDWKDVNNLKKSNPNIGVSVYEEYLRDQIQMAINNPLEEVNVRTKHCNQWLSSSNGWIPLTYIYDSTSDVELSEYQDNYAYVGLDLSSVSDLTAISVLVMQDDKFIFKNYCFLPNTALSENGYNREKYKQWNKEGYLNVTNGNVIDYQYIKNKIMEISNIVPIACISYDQWNSTSLITELTSEGMNCQAYSQAIGSISRAAKYLEILIRSGKVVIDNNPITRWNFANSTLFTDSNGNIKITKESNNNKIDIVIAMIMALGKYMTDNESVFGFTSMDDYLSTN